MKKFRKATMFVSTTTAVANVLPVAEVKADGFWKWLWQWLVGRFFTTNTENFTTANSQEKEPKGQVDMFLRNEKEKKVNAEQNGISLDKKKKKIVKNKDFSGKNREIVVDSFAQLKKNARFVSPKDSETEFTLSVLDFREINRSFSNFVFNPLIKVCLLEDEVHFVSLKSKEVLERLSLTDENFEEKYSKSLVWLKSLKGVYDLVYSNVFSAKERPMSLQVGNSKDSLVFNPNFDCKIDFEIEGSKGRIVKSLELNNVNLCVRIQTEGSALDFDLRNCGDLESLKSVIENLDYDFKEEEFSEIDINNIVYESRT